MVELEVLAKKFDRFGWERDRGTAAHDRQMRDWFSALEDYPLNEVQDACRVAVLNNPNKMPNEGHVRAQVIATRANMVSRIPEPEPEREPPVTKEVAADIMEKNGFRVNKFGGVG